MSPFCWQALREARASGLLGEPCALAGMDLNVVNRGTAVLGAEVGASMAGNGRQRVSAHHCVQSLEVSVQYAPQTHRADCMPWHSG